MPLFWAQFKCPFELLCWWIHHHHFVMIIYDNSKYHTVHPKAMLIAHTLYLHTDNSKMRCSNSFFFSFFLFVCNLISSFTLGLFFRKKWVLTISWRDTNDYNYCIAHCRKSFKQLFRLICGSYSKWKSHFYGDFLQFVCISAQINSVNQRRFILM